MGESRNDYPRHCRCCWRVIRTVDEDHANYEYGGVCEQCAKRSGASEIKLFFPEDVNEVDADQRDGGYVAELEQENAQLREIVQRIATRDEDTHGSMVVCHWNCGAYTTSLKEIPLQHAPDCVVVQARALLTREEKQP